jgi:hypothetical protein
MNKAITQGLVLMPPPFSAGLDLWSSADGLPGDGSYQGQANAAYVPSDQDFAGCLELQKTASVQKLRCFQAIPFQPGLYLRVTTRVKAVSGALPAVRIAGWAGNSSGGNVSAADQQGDLVQLTQYGTAVTITAIIGSGNRQGVDMTWGATPTYGHFGIDLTGPTGGVVRIDDVTIEDVTSVFHDEMFNWVDVRDYGAIGDGVTDDRDAFEAADTAANGKTVIVSSGTYFIGSHLTFDNPVKFEGVITMPDAMRLACTRNYNLDTYAAAFGSELTGFKRALQVLFYFTDHNMLDLGGRRIELDAPIDAATICGLTEFTQRRVISNGNLVALASTAWNNVTATATATYTPANSYELTGVSNIGTIPVGALVSGTGVGREVYVRAKNNATNTLTLSQALWGGAGTRSYSFTRFKYMLDFSGFDKLARLEMHNIEFGCNALASAVILADSGSVNVFNDCAFNQPKDRAITSKGTACQDLQVNRCLFYSSEESLLAQDRFSVAMNANANDVKIRENRASRFAHFAVVAGQNTMFIGNHLFSGDGADVGVRKAGVVVTYPASKTYFTGNYIDNCFIEYSNEHDAYPDYDSEYTFGATTITGNIFICQHCAPWFSWIVVTPRGPGHSISGMTVTSNVFSARQGNLDRAESIDTSYATLAYTSFKNINFQDNTFNGMNTNTLSPLFLEHVQSSEASTWAIDTAGQLPFGGRARNLVSLVTEGAITNSGGSAQYVMPYCEVEKGTGGQTVNLRWPSAVKGKVQALIRGDNPV